MYDDIVNFWMEVKNYNFEWEKCIGRGRFGKVYLCFDKKEW